MSVCVICGAYAPPDPNTGYRADRLCHRCQADGYSETPEGVELQPLRVECAWCKQELRPGPEPASHSICDACKQKVEADLPCPI